MKRTPTLLLALAFAAAPGFANAQGPPPPRSIRALPESFKPYDANEDGRLSREEYKVYIEDSRSENPKSEWDEDGDGKLSEAEIAAARAAMRARLEARFLARFVEADTGGAAEGGPDQLLDLEEFTKTLPDDVTSERAQAAFTRLDANADGKISNEEFLKFNGLPPRPVVPKPPKPRPDIPKPKPPVAPPLPERLKIFDLDGNGILSRAEISKAIENGTWPVRPAKPPVPPGDPGDPEVPVTGGE